MSESPNADRVTGSPVCPVCQGSLRHIYTGARGGVFWCEMSLFMCPTHGAVCGTREGLDPPDRDKDDSGSLIHPPDKPPLTPNRAAAAIWESTEPDLPLSVRSDRRVEP